MSGLASQALLLPPGLIAVSAIGDRTGDYNFTSSTFTDVDADFNLSIVARVGERLLLWFATEFFHSSVTGQIRVKFAIAGTTLTTMPTLGLLETHHPGTSGTAHGEFSWLHTVLTGDIASGVVAVKPQVATGSSTLTINNNSNNAASFRVVNLGR